MMRSEQINELAAALACAQGKIGGAAKDSTNPFYDSKYADLASVWSACREALADNKLSVVQTATAGYETAMGELIVPRVTVTTTLLHASGQWLSSDLPMWPKDSSPHAIGSAISYARRYALAAMVGVYQSDDDANAAQSGLEKLSIEAAAYAAKSAAGIPEFTQPLVPEGMDAVMAAIVKEDVKAMRLAWNDATGLGTGDAIWKLLNTKQKKVARELLNITAPKDDAATGKAVQG